MSVSGKVLNATSSRGGVFGMQITARVASLILLFSAFTAQADISLSAPRKPTKEAELGSPPPEPVPVNVRVKRGGVVEIPLRVFGIPNQPVTYRLRALPGLGRLSELKMVGRGLGVLTYQHSGAKTQESDQFLYAAQTAKGVSGSVRVNITIVDDPPNLSAPEELDLDTVMIGSTATRKITIENRGGGVMNGTIAIDEPWKIDGKATYSLRSGEKQTFGLTFAPQVEQTFHGLIRYSSDPRHTTALRAVAEAAVSVMPRLLELTPARETIRAGILRIANRTSEEQPLRLHAGNRLSVPEQVSVPPNGEISVLIETAPGQVDQIAEEVQVDSPSFATRIAVQVPAAGPIIRANPVSLSFGKIDADRPTTATLQVANFGGTQAHVRVAAPAPFVIASADSAFWLNAGATKDVTVSLLSVDAGRIEATLQIKTSGAELDIPVEVEVAGRPVADRASSRRDAGVKAGSLQTAAPSLRPSQIENVRIGRVTSTTCEIAWHVTAKAQPQYQFERLVTAGNGFDWTPIANVVIKTAGSPQDFGKNLAMHGVADPDAASPEPSEAVTIAPAITALIKNLSPNTAYKVRIVTIDPKDAANRSSVPVEFHTSPMLAQTIALRFVLPSFLVLSVIMIRRRSSKRAGSVGPDSESTAKPKPPETFVPAALRPEPAPAGRRKIPALRELGPGRFELDVD